MLKQFDEFGRDLAERLEGSFLAQPVLICAACEGIISNKPERLEKRGAHRHRCVNPHGIAFEIGCFRYAEKCRGVGTATFADTWFPGYAWQVQVCGSCGAHVGWQFSADSGDGFYGLILSALLER